MVAGTWNNQDGLYLQFGTQKAVPEVGGDYLVYGETREIEQFIPLVPYQLTTSGLQVPAPPTSFVSASGGASAASAAGIQSLTTLVPLQITAPQVTTTGGVLLLTASNLFFEEVEVDTLITATGGTSINVGLATINPATQAFVQVTPNAGVQLIDTLVIANLVAGKKIKWTLPGTTGLSGGTAAGNTIAGGGAWLGNVPLVTNAITPLPTAAYISTIATGAFTNGLIKLRLRYTVYGTINQ